MSKPETETRVGHGLSFGPRRGFVGIADAGPTPPVVQVDPGAAPHEHAEAEEAAYLEAEVTTWEDDGGQADVTTKAG